MTTFGKGPVEVRIYTDYFCGPCRAEEKEVMALITELVEKTLIRVTFIDTPIHKETVLYAGYFLFGAECQGGSGYPPGSRAAGGALRGGGRENHREGRRLELFLKKKGIALRPFDTAPVFKIFGNYLKEDRINSTPTCVISRSAGKADPRGKRRYRQGAHQPPEIGDCCAYLIVNPGLKTIVACILSDTSLRSLRTARLLSGVRLPMPQEGVIRHCRSIVLRSMPFFSSCFIPSL